MSKRAKEKHVATFAQKVHALHSKGFSLDSAKRIAGAMLQHAKGRITKAEKEARKLATRAANKLHHRICD